VLRTDVSNRQRTVRDSKQGERSLATDGSEEAIDRGSNPVTPEPFYCGRIALAHFVRSRDPPLQKRS